MVCIVATMKAKAGKENDLVGVMKELVAAVRKNEPGALDYTFHRSSKDPTSFMVYERYKDGAAVQAHMSSAHFQDAMKKMGGFTDGKAGIEMYEVVV